MCASHQADLSTYYIDYMYNKTRTWYLVSIVVNAVVAIPCHYFYVKSNREGHFPLHSKLVSGENYLELAPEGVSGQV